MTGAQIKYVLTIYQIQKETGARLTDIAETMQISKPSVYQMIGQLNKIGLVKSNGQGRYVLTEMGQDVAAGYAKQYFALYQFLIQEICMQQESANTVATSLLALDDHALSELFTGTVCTRYSNNDWCRCRWHCRTGDAGCSPDGIQRKKQPTYGGAVCTEVSVCAGIY